MMKPTPAPLAPDPVRWLNNQPYLLLSKPDGTVGKLTVNGSGVVTWTAL